MKFFSEYNRFTKVTGHANSEDRLNQRYKAIIECNQSSIKGKRILDVGAHDGRWAFAAIKAGAKHVTCIEEKDTHVTWLRDNMEHYRAKNFDVIQGDVHEEIGKINKDIDTIFCLGFFYHSLEHAHLMRKFSGLANTLILDTHVIQGEGKFIQLHREHNNKLTGTPSREALDEMMEAYGFNHVDYFDWSKINNVQPDYAGNYKILGHRINRITLKAKRT